VVYLVRIRFGTTLPVVTSLSAIPQQEQSFAGIALHLVMCVLPGLYQHLLSAIAIAIKVAIAEPVSYGHGWPRFAGPLDGVL
jgi:hypothetical protein